MFKRYHLGSVCPLFVLEPLRPFRPFGPRSSPGPCLCLCSRCEVSVRLCLPGFGLVWFHYLYLFRLLVSMVVVFIILVRIYWLSLVPSVSARWRDTYFLGWWSLNRRDRPVSCCQSHTSCSYLAWAASDCGWTARCCPTMAWHSSSSHSFSPLSTWAPLFFDGAFCACLQRR